MNLRRLLTIANALLIGGIIGWAARTHTVNDRWMMSKVDKYEAEASFWFTKNDELIQQSKAQIKERNNVKR